MGEGRWTVVGIVLAAAVAATACARPPRPLAGEFPPTTPGDVQASARIGERVRWGGEVVETTPRDGETCFEVVAKPLDRETRPRPVDQTGGRFIACVPGFYDPAVWKAGREITTVGTVDALVSGKVGDSPYVYPHVRADAVHLWPERPPAAVVYDPWPGPFWAPWPYFSWYGAGVVRVHPVAPCHGRH